MKLTVKERIEQSAATYGAVKAPTLSQMADFVNENSDVFRARMGFDRVDVFTANYTKVFGHNRKDTYAKNSTFARWIVKNVLAD